VSQFQYQHVWRFRGIMTAIFVSTIVWFLIADLAVRLWL